MSSNDILSQTKGDERRRSSSGSSRPSPTPQLEKGEKEKMKMNNHHSLTRDDINHLIIKKLECTENHSSSPYCLWRLRNLISYCHDGKNKPAIILENSCKTLEGIINLKKFPIGSNFDDNAVTIFNAYDESSSSSCIEKLHAISDKVFNKRDFRETPIGFIAPKILRGGEINDDDDNFSSSSSVALFSCLFINHPWWWDSIKMNFKQSNGIINEKREAFTTVIPKCGVAVWNNDFVIIRIPCSDLISPTLSIRDNNSLEENDIEILNLSSFSSDDDEDDELDKNVGCLTLIVPCTDISQVFSQSAFKDNLQKDDEGMNIDLHSLRNKLSADKSLLRKLVTATLNRKNNISVKIPTVNNSECSTVKLDSSDFEQIDDKEKIFAPGYLEHYAPGYQSLSISDITVLTKTFINENGIKIEAASRALCVDGCNPPPEAYISINRPFMYIVSQGYSNIFSIGYVNK